MSQENAEFITEQCFFDMDGFDLKYSLTEEEEEVDLYSEEVLDMFFSYGN